MSYFLNDKIIKMKIDYWLPRIKEELRTGWMEVGLVIKGQHKGPLQENELSVIWTVLI